MNSELELCISYENRCKLVFFQSGTTTLLQFKDYLKKEFKIEAGDLILFDLKRNAEITSTKSFKEENPITIQIIPEDPIASTVVNVGNDNILELSSNSINVEFNSLIGKKFSEDNLLIELNNWANQKKFKLAYSEGAKKTKTGIKRTLVCHISKCPYKIVVVSENEGQDYLVYEKITRKYTQHSKSFFSSY